MYICCNCLSTFIKPEIRKRLMYESCPVCGSEDIEYIEKGETDDKSDEELER